MTSGWADNCFNVTARAPASGWSTAAKAMIGVELSFSISKSRPVGSSPSTPMSAS